LELEADAGLCVFKKIKIQRYSVGLLPEKQIKKETEALIIA
jgi:hypothetical protein